MILDKFLLTGQVGIVTGGGQGLGKVFCHAFAEAGADIVVAEINESTGPVTVDEVISKGRRALFIPTDVRDPESVTAMVNQTLATFGRIDFLMNNAGIVHHLEVEKVALSDWQNVLDVNLNGVFLCSQIVGRHMIQRQQGCIINIASIQGMVAPDYTLYEGLGLGVDPDYWFHKGGMINLTRYVASTLGPSGVRVNTISPGGLFNNQDERFLKRYNARTFLGRMANETDLKGAIVFLASDASAYVTGTNIVVDGGYTSK